MATILGDVVARVAVGVDRWLVVSALRGRVCVYSDRTHTGQCVLLCSLPVETVHKLVHAMATAARIVEGVRARGVPPVSWARTMGVSGAVPDV